VKDILAFDPREDRRAEVEAVGVATTSELGALWDAKPEAALVTAPTKMHVPIALAAAEVGCHLFLEKPISDVHDGPLDQLLDVVERKKLVTLVGCNLRFHPGLAAARRVLDSGRLGRLVSIRAEFGAYLPDWHPWEDYRQGYSARANLGGGVVLDAIHELDYVRWLMGDVEYVAALVGKLSGLSIDTEDTASILLRFKSGIFGEVHLDYVQRTYTRACTIVGDGGTLSWDFANAGGIRVFDGATKSWDDAAGPAGWDTNQMYVDEMKHFLACVAGSEKPEQDVVEATRVLDIALAAKLSSERNSFVHVGRSAG
jgi:predicted dehydrogenase